MMCPFCSITMQRLGCASVTFLCSNCNYFATEEGLRNDRGRRQATRDRSPPAQAPAPSYSSSASTDGPWWGIGS